MMIFWLLVAGLIGLALLFIVPPILRGKPKRAGVDLDELNLAVFRQQLKELEADLEAGDLDQARYQAARRDLEWELLEDVSGTTESDRTQRRSGRWARNHAITPTTAYQPTSAAGRITPSSTVAWRRRAVRSTAQMVPARGSQAAQPSTRPRGRQASPPIVASAPQSIT